MVKAKGVWVPAHLMLKAGARFSQPLAAPRTCTSLWHLPSGLPVVLGPPETLLAPGSCLKLPFQGLGAGGVRALEEVAGMLKTPGFLLWGSAAHRDVSTQLPIMPRELGTG